MYYFLAGMCFFWFLLGVNRAFTGDWNVALKITFGMLALMALAILTLYFIYLGATHVVTN